MEAFIPCKIRSGQCKENFVEHLALIDRKYVCIVEANESARKRLDGTQHQDHEDHLAGKEINSLIHYNLVRKFIPVLPSNTNSGSQIGGGQKMGTARENASIAVDESQERKKGQSGGTQKVRQDSTFLLH